MQSTRDTEVAFRSGGLGWAVARVALFAVALAPGFLLDPRAVLDTIAPLSLDVPASIDLGTLRPSERKDAVLPIVNRSWRAIALRPLASDCGCLVVSDAPGELARGAAAEARLSIVAPSRPGRFSRSVLIRPRGQERPAWTVSVEGVIAADAWAEPSQLALVLDDERQAEARVVLHHVPEFRPGRLVASSGQVQIVETRPAERALLVTVRIDAPADSQSARGRAVLELFDASDRPAVSVPVRWSPTAQLGYVPHHVDLQNFDREPADANRLRRIVALLLPAEASSDDVQLSVLVPWARIAHQTMHESALRLEIEFDRATMPDRVDLAILSARLADGGAQHKLYAHGKRSSPQAP